MLSASNTKIGQLTTDYDRQRLKMVKHHIKDLSSVVSSAQLTSSTAKDMFNIYILHRIMFIIHY